MEPYHYHNEVMRQLNDTEVKKDCDMVTGDITSLYTNMNTQTAIDKVKQILKENWTSELLIELLQIMWGKQFQI